MLIRLRLLDPGRVRLRTAVRTVAAAVAALLAAGAVSRTADLPGGMVVIATVVAVMVSRSLHATSLPHRLSALVQVPLVGILATFVGRLMVQNAWFGAVVFVAAVGGSRYLMRFGGRIRRFGRLALTPLIAVLVTPVPPSAAKATGPLWGAVCGVIAVGCVIGSQVLFPSRPTREAAGAAGDFLRAAARLRALAPGGARHDRAALALHRTALTVEDRLDAARLPDGADRAPLDALAAAVLIAEVGAQQEPHAATGPGPEQPGGGGSVPERSSGARFAPEQPGGGGSVPAPHAATGPVPYRADPARLVPPRALPEQAVPKQAVRAPAVRSRSGAEPAATRSPAPVGPDSREPCSADQESGRPGPGRPGSGRPGPEEPDSRGAGSGRPQSEEPDSGGPNPAGPYSADQESGAPAPDVPGSGSVHPGEGAGAERPLAVADDPVDAALAAVRSAAAAVRGVRSVQAPAPDVPAARARPGGWRDPQPQARLSAQLVVAMSAAFALGHLAFPRHWTWTVITAFVVCGAARGRGDVVHRSGLRVAGAFTGAVTGTLVAHVVTGDTAAAIAVIFCYLLIGLWLRETTYAAWALCVTSLLAVLNSLDGEQGSALILQRPEGILLGSACGIAAACFVLPLPTAVVMRGRAATALRVLQELLAAAREPEPRTPVVRRLARRFDRATRELAVAATPARAHRTLTRRTLGHPAPAVRRTGPVAPHPADWVDSLTACAHATRALALSDAAELAAARPQLGLAARNLGQVRRRLGHRPDAAPPRPARTGPPAVIRLDAALAELYDRLPAPPVGQPGPPPAPPPAASPAAAG